MTTQEYETKILDIDVPSFKRKLHQLGLRCNRPRHLVRRWVFSLPNKKDNSWVRIIEESDVKGQLALAYKSYASYQIGGIREYEVAIKGKISEMRNFFELLGCSLIAEQHSYEEQYQYPGQKNIKIEIQEWPLIPPYVEIEGKNENEVTQALTDLGFDINKSQPVTTKMVYEKYGINLHDYKTLSFNRAPAR